MTRTYEFCRRGTQASECNISVGQQMRNTRKGLLIVTRVSEPIDEDNGQKPWAQSYWAREATDEERQAAELAARRAALEAELRGLSGPADDDRDHEQREARREAIRAALAH